VIYLAAGLVLLFVLAGAGRQVRQRQALASLRRDFVVRARAAMEVYLPSLAPAVSDEEYGRAFDWIYAEHLTRLGARDLAGLMRKGQGTEAESISFDICNDAAKTLCAAFPTNLGDDPEHASTFVQMALSDGLFLGGQDMYAEMVPDG
jgi:hypothetical protein